MLLKYSSARLLLHCTLLKYSGALQCAPPRRPVALEARGSRVDSRRLAVSWDPGGVPFYFTQLEPRRARAKKKERGEL